MKIGAILVADYAASRGVGWAKKAGLGFFEAAILWRAGVDLRLGSSQTRDVKRRPIAAIVPRQASWEHVSTVLESLESARAFEVSVVKTQSWLDRPLDGFRRWGMGARLALGLSAYWMRRPRAQRPELLVAFGAAAPGVVDAARVLGVPTVVWVGFDLGGTVPAVTLERARSVWAGDRATLSSVAREGLRASLVTPGPQLVQPESDARSSSQLSVLLPRAAQLAQAERSSIHRFGEAEVEVVGIGDTDEGLGHRFVSRKDRQARLSALERSRAVVALEPATQATEVIEALLFGRPLIVPDTDLPRFFGARLGRTYRSGKADALSDALAEVWTGVERGAYTPSALRDVGVAEAIASQAPMVAARLLSMLADSG